jgi:putative transposase
MTNHVHLLMTPEVEQGPSRCMQALGRKYVRYVNDVYRRTGTLWEGRFKSALIDSEPYLLVCHRYIELNPVRAKMVAEPGSYRWSSYAHNALGKREAGLVPHPRYLALGAAKVQRLAVYRSLFEGHVDSKSTETIRTATERGTVVGSDAFKEEVATVLARRVTKYGHGGDRRSEGFRKRRNSSTPTA